MTDQQVNDTEIFDMLIKKLDNVKETVNKMKNHSNNNIHVSVDYIQKLNQFSLELNSLVAISNDIYDEYILNMDCELLTNDEINRQKNLQINKKIEKIFLPYMLYLQIILQNR